MDYAKERREGGKLIQAHSAVPGRYYTCPTCFAEVFLRRGRWRVPHFAHRAGAGKASCENFHPSDGITYSWPSHSSQLGETRSYRPSEPLSLGIELQPESMRRGSRLREWGLCVTVPKSEDTHGQITFDCGGGTTRRVNLIKLSLGAQTYPVDFNAEDFGAVWVSPEVKGEYREVVEDRVRGLDRELGTLFAASAQRLKPRVDRVSWGGSYYFVWHETFELVQPKDLVSHPLATINQWKCVLVTLPDDEDAEIKTWLEDATAVSISQPRRVFGIIYPPPSGSDVLGRVLIPSSDGLVVGFRQVGADDATAATLRVTSADASVEVSLDRPGRHLARVELDSSKAHIYIKLNDANLPVIVPTAISRENLFPSVEFLVRDRVSGVTSPATIGSKDAYLRLDGVRAGLAEISQLSVPSSVRGHIRWKRTGEIARSSLEIGRDSEARTASFRARELGQINELLQDRQVEIEVDFGSFGCYRALSSKINSLPKDQVLSVSLRRRIQWLLIASSVLVDHRGVSVKRLRDEAAVALLKKVQIPAHLLAQHRSITSELGLTSLRGVAP